LEGRRTGTKGEMIAMQYIADQFSKNGLQPKGTNGFIQEFTINEGKQFDETGNTFSVNDVKLELKKDFSHWLFLQINQLMVLHLRAYRKRMSHGFLT